MIFLSIILGGIIGGIIPVVGGLWGAIIGGILGMLSSGTRKTSSYSADFSSIAGLTRQQAKTVFFQITFLVMGRIAKIDGRVSKNEINQAEIIMGEMQLTATQRQEAIKLFQQGKNPEFDLEESLEEFKRMAKMTILLPTFLEIQLQAAYADGYLSDQKHAYFKKLCTILNYNLDAFYNLHERFLAQRAYYQYRNHSSRFSDNSPNTYQLQQAYSVLGVRNSDTLQDIKRSYRKLMSQHHPDKLIAKGMPENMIDVAKKQTQKIQSAYDVIYQYKKKHKK